MVVGVEVCGVELPILQNDQNKVFAVELAKILTALIVIQALHIVVKPNLASTKCTTTLRL